MGVKGVVGSRGGWGLGMAGIGVGGESKGGGV